MKKFKCENGNIYKFPNRHCAFCENCEAIIYDYTHGPYMFLCNLGLGDYKTCKKFKKEKN